MIDNPDTFVYLETLRQYWTDAELGLNDGTAASMPKPPNPDVAWEVVTICSKSIAALLDYKKTGHLPDDWDHSSPESQLEAAAIIQRRQDERGV